MCSTSACDLEDVPLDDDDPDSIEFKILAFYAKHYVFKGPPAVFSPKRQRKRTLSQQGLGNWSAESWTQVLRSARGSSSSEKHINLGKKKYSWRSIFGVTEKEEEPTSSPKETHRQGLVQAQGLVEFQGPCPSEQGSRSISNVAQHVENEGRLGESFLSMPKSFSSLCARHFSLLSSKERP